MTSVIVRYQVYKSSWNSVVFELGDIDQVARFKAFVVRLVHNTTEFEISFH